MRKTKNKTKVILLIILGVCFIGAMTSKESETSPIICLILGILCFYVAYRIWKRDKNPQLEKTEDSKFDDIAINSKEEVRLKYGLNNVSWNKAKSYENIKKEFKINIYNFGINSDEKFFYINRHNKTYKFEFKDFVDYEVTYTSGKEITKIKGNVLATMTGGLILGPLGALMGSVKSRKIEKKTKKGKYSIDVYINSIDLSHIGGEVNYKNLKDINGYLMYIENNK